MISLKRPHKYHIADGMLSGARQYASTHYDKRPDDTIIDAIVIHHISLPPDEFGARAPDGTPYVAKLFMGELDPDAHPYFATIVGRVSAHLFIDRDGEVCQFVNLNDRAWHAGVSDFLGRQNYNDFSIGIELEGSNQVPFTDMQYDTLAQVCIAIHSAYPPTRRGLYGHSDIARGRKNDPGVYFDWRRLRGLISAYF